MISMFHFIDPVFSVGMLDMLVQGSPTAWLLLGLASTIVYAVLSRLTLFRKIGDRQNESCKPDTQQSD